MKLVNKEDVSDLDEIFKDASFRMNIWLVSLFIVRVQGMKTTLDVGGVWRSFFLEYIKRINKLLIIIIFFFLGKI